MPQGALQDRFLATIRDYHAHIYFDQRSVEVARELRNAIGDRFDAELGNWNVEQVGPHPRWSAEILFAPPLFGSLVPWLALNRRGLAVLVHPNTGDELADHRDHALWLGEMLPLKLHVLRPANPIRPSPQE